MAGVSAIVRMATNSPDSEPISNSEALELYREWLLELGAPVTDENGELVRRGFAATEDGTQLSQAAQLSTRIRYFTASLVIGSRTFCEEHFHRHALGPKRQNGARPLRHGNWGGLCGLRDLRRNVIGASR